MSPVILQAVDCTWPSRYRPDGTFHGESRGQDSPSVPRNSEPSTAHLAKDAAAAHQKHRRDHRQEFRKQNKPVDGEQGPKYVYPAPRFKGIEDVKPKDKDDKKDGDDGKRNRPNDDDKETRSNDPDQVDGDENDSDISIGDLNTMFA